MFNLINYPIRGTWYKIKVRLKLRPKILPKKRVKVIPFSYS